MLRALLILAMCGPATALADSEADLREAVGALARTSYRWETTVRQKFNGETTEPRVNLDAALEVRGKTEPNGYTEVTLQPTRDFPAPMTAVFRQGDVVMQTSSGWLRRTDVRETPGPDREVEFEGKRFKRSRVFTVGFKAANVRPPSEELLDLISDLKTVRNESGLLVGELKDRLIEQMWGDAQAKRAPEVHGAVIFKLNEQGLGEYHVVLGIGFPNSRTKTVRWSMQQWTTRLAGVGSTAVDPPGGAVEALSR